MLKYLRNDEEIDEGVPVRRALARVLKQASQMVPRGFNVGRGSSRLTLSYWIARYYLGFIFSPLRSQSLIVVKVSTGKNKQTVDAIARASQSDWFVMQNIFVRRIYDKPYETWCKDPKTIVDLGSNIGLSPLYFSSRFPDATIVCVEPTYENNAVARKNAGPNWIIEEAAISGESGMVEFGMSEWGGSGSAVQKIWRYRQSRKNRVEARSATVRKVPALTMDDLIKKHNLRTIDIIKIDIEGAEEDVFLGNLNWLSQTKIIVIEVHDKHIDGAMVRKQLTANGFTKHSSSSEVCEVYVAGD